MKTEWYFTICSEIGNVNELCCGGCDQVARRMMDTFENAGYIWANDVNGSREMVYRLDRRSV